jgi:hypothetical protein
MENGEWIMDKGECETWSVIHHRPSPIIPHPAMNGVKISRQTSEDYRRSSIFQNENEKKLRSEVSEADW